MSTYESASIRRFRLGRVDNIRACTVEALEWCEAMTGKTPATVSAHALLMDHAYIFLYTVLINSPVFSTLFLTAIFGFLFSYVSSLGFYFPVKVEVRF